MPSAHQVPVKSPHLMMTVAKALPREGAPMFRFKSGVGFGFSFRQEPKDLAT
jgi:hypothetical protein